MDNIDDVNEGSIVRWIGLYVWENSKRLEYAWQKRLISKTSASVTIHADSYLLPFFNTRRTYKYDLTILRKLTMAPSNSATRLQIIFKTVPISIISKASDSFKVEPPIASLAHLGAARVSYIAVRTRTFICIPLANFEKSETTRSRVTYISFLRYKHSNIRIQWVTSNTSFAGRNIEKDFLNLPAQLEMGKKWEKKARKYRREKRSFSVADKEEGKGERWQNHPETL